MPPPTLHSPDCQCKTASSQTGPGSYISQDSDSLSIQSLESPRSESDLALSMPPPSRSPSPLPLPAPEMDIVEDDEEFFIESSFVVFHVQGRRFRVPSYLLEKESQLFSPMFNLSYHTEPDSNRPESSVSNPIILPDEYTKEDFRNFLKALYPTSFTPKLTLAKSEWLSVLKLSTEWRFPNLRSTAISELEHPGWLTSVEKITYGRTYRISSWIIDGLVDLIAREEPLTNAEALAISEPVGGLNLYTTTAFTVFRLREALAVSESVGGLNLYTTTAFTVFRLREARLLLGQRGAFYHTPGGTLSDVESEFKDELADVRADEKAPMVLELGKPEDKIVEELETPAPGTPCLMPRDELKSPQPPPVPEPEPVPGPSIGAGIKKKKKKILHRV